MQQTGQPADSRLARSVFMIGSVLQRKYQSGVSPKASYSLASRASSTASAICRYAATKRSTLPWVSRQIWLRARPYWNWSPRIQIGEIHHVLHPQRQNVSIKGGDFHSLQKGYRKILLLNGFSGLLVAGTGVVIRQRNHLIAVFFGPLHQFTGRHTAVGFHGMVVKFCSLISHSPSSFPMTSTSYGVWSFNT